MKLRRGLSFPRQDGFSLLEMMLSMLILTLVMGVVFEQLSAAQYRTANEQANSMIFSKSGTSSISFFAISTR